MTIDNACGLSANRDIGKDSNDKTCADGDAVDRRYDRLVAIDNIVNEILGLLPSRHSRDRVVENTLDQLEITPRRKSFASPGHDDRVDISIVVDITPDIGELSVGLGVDRIVGLGPVKCEPENPLGRIVELQFGICSITIGHRLPFWTLG